MNQPVERTDTYGRKMNEMDRHLIEPGEFPHGLLCMDCDEPLRPGDTYSKRLVAFMGDDPVVELVCIPCAMWGEGEGRVAASSGLGRSLPQPGP